MHPSRRRARAFSAAAAITALVLAGSATATAVGTTQDRTSSGKATYTKLAGSQVKSPSKGTNKGYVKLDLLAINDFHGQLEPVPSTSSGGRINNTPAGGVAYLARLLREERAKSRAAHATPLTVAAGDLIGASPLLSAAFHDEPSIKAMNKLGLQVASVGNHEFDEGWRELRRMQSGGCIADGPDGANGQNSCPAKQGFDGADFRYLAANVKWADQSGHRRPTLFPSTKVMKVHGQKVGFIGMTLQGTPSIVAQAGIQGLTFTDEVETANALVPKLRKRGVKSIVVLLHEGVVPGDPASYNDCTNVTGPALEIAQNLDPAIDAVVSGHTHFAYNCVVKDPKGQPRLLTSAMSTGRMMSKIHLLIDPQTHDVVRPAEYAENLIVENDASVEPVPALQSLVDTYKRLVAPIENEVIGHIAPEATAMDKITRDDADKDGDSALGNLIADAQKADDSVVTEDGQAPVIALMNPGGIRNDLLENDSGDVTYGAAFSVQPFNNFVVSMDLTGAQIKTILNQQWNGATNEGAPKILQVSGLTYIWDASEAAAPDTDALVPGSVMVDDDGDPGTPMVQIQDGTTYRVVANNFLSDGGDNFAGFKDGTNKLIGGLDIDSLRKYLVAHDPVEPTPTDRISVQP